MKKVIEIAERYDFENVRDNGSAFFMNRGKETLFFNNNHLIYDSAVAYGPAELGNRMAQWPKAVVVSNEFESLFANTVGV